MATTSFNLPSRWLRPLVLLDVSVFGISTIFPIVAGIVASERLPAWLGYLDVGLAFILVIITLLVTAVAGTDLRSRAKQLSYQVYRGSAHLLLVLLILFFTFGDQLHWNILLPGLAWRVWLFIYALPAGLTVWELGKSSARREIVSQRS